MLAILPAWLTPAGYPGWLHLTPRADAWFSRRSVESAISELLDRLDREAYVADPAIATSLWLSMTLKKPLLVEGHAGVGKTEIAKVLARMLETDLIRLQCYEGLDASTALYEWNYPKQLLHIRLQERDAKPVAEAEAQIFGEPFLLKRPLL